MRGDLAALLWRGGIERVQRTELGGQPFEGTQLPRDARRPGVTPLGRRIRIDRLPDKRRPVVGIVQQQPVQEGGSAARQAGDEDRPSNLLPLNAGIARFGVLEAQ